MPDQTAPPAALRAFLARLIDYAGLFPPAALPLPDAFHLYARYRHQPYAWMLGRFIVPAARLPALSPLLAGRFTPDYPLPLALLGRPSPDADAFVSYLALDLQDVAAFRHAHGPATLADTFELRLPPAPTAAAALALIRPAVALLAGHGLTTTFFEATPGPDWPASIAALVQALGRHNETAATPAGFKLRAGGVEAAAFPSVDQVAVALLAARDARVPLKATAGLHHPLRRYDPTVQTRMHGFLNLFGAALLAHLHHLDHAAVRPILADESPAHFSFDDGGFTWQALRASTADIVALRACALLSFGSCSFDEPLEDLRALGLL